MKSSKVLLRAYWTRASGLSILLMTTMILWPRARALLRTNLVWGIGPSWASIRKRQPSASFRTRSPSPAKVASPGVLNVGSFLFRKAPGDLQGKLIKFVVVYLQPLFVSV